MAGTVLGEMLPGHHWAMPSQTVSGVDVVAMDRCADAVVSSGGTCSEADILRAFYGTDTRPPTGWATDTIQNEGVLFAIADSVDKLHMGDLVVRAEYDTQGNAIPKDPGGANYGLIVARDGGDSSTLRHSITEERTSDGCCRFLGSLSCTILWSQETSETTPRIDTHTIFELTRIRGELGHTFPATPPSFTLMGLVVGVDEILRTMFVPYGVLVKTIVSRVLSAQATLAAHAHATGYVTDRQTSET